MKLSKITILAAASAMTLASVAAAAPAATYHAPKNAFGQPDLQGDWTNATITPFERDKKYGARLALTDQEVKGLEGDNAQLVADGNKPTDPNAKVTDLPQNCGRGFVGVDCGYNSAWVDPGTRIIDMGGVKRDSILISPANGRLPKMTPDAAARMQARFSGRLPQRLRQSGNCSLRASAAPSPFWLVRRAADAAAAVQQQLPDRADQGRDRHRRGDGPRRAPHPPHRQPSAGEREAVDGR